MRGFEFSLQIHDFRRRLREMNFEANVFCKFRLQIGDALLLVIDGSTQGLHNALASLYFAMDCGKFQSMCMDTLSLISNDAVLGRKLSGRVLTRLQRVGQRTNLRIKVTLEPLQFTMNVWRAGLWLVGQG